METSNYSSTSSKSSAEEELVDEQIDPEILEILGLDDVFDLDQSDYMSLLKEAIVKSNQGLIDLTPDQLSLLSNERKRIRDKKNIKFSTKKINSNSFFNRKDEEKTENKIIDPKKILPPSNTLKSDDVKNDSDDDQQENELSNLKSFLTNDLFKAIENISSIVKNIESLLEKRNSLLEKESENKRKESVKSGFREKESDLESGEGKASKFGKILSKITKPFNSLFDTIGRFLTNVLAGSFLNWLLSVFEDPRKLLQPIQDLLDGIFNFFNNIIDWMDNTFVNPIRYLIDTVNDGISGFIDILNSALSLIPGASPIEAPQIPNIPEPPKLEAPDLVGRNEQNNPQAPEINIQTKNKGGLVVGLKKSGGNITKNNVTNLEKNKIINNIQNVKNEKNNSIYDPILENGGKVDYNTGIRVKGLEPDTQLTALRKDEYVLVPGAARALGINRLDALNKKFGGDNKERYVSLDKEKVKLFSGGGRVVTSEMGNRNFALSPGMHMGVDISGTVGEPLKAFTNGIIEDTGFEGGYGNYVNWIDSSGIAHFYAHMNRPAPVRKNQRVNSGTKIGELGNTGRSSGPHLHWESATNPADTGRSKSAVLSRFNPLSRYSKDAPFGGVPGSPESNASSPTSPTSTSSSQTNDESSPSDSSSEMSMFDRSVLWAVRGDPSNPRNKGFKPLSSNPSQLPFPTIGNNSNADATRLVSQLQVPNSQTTETLRNIVNTSGSPTRETLRNIVNTSGSPTRETLRNIVGSRNQGNSPISNLSPAAQTSGGTEGMMRRLRGASNSNQISPRTPTNLPPAAQTPGGTEGMMRRLRNASNQISPRTLISLPSATQTPGGTEGMMRRLRSASDINTVNRINNIILGNQSFNSLNSLSPSFNVENLKNERQYLNMNNTVKAKFGTTSKERMIPKPPSSAGNVKMLPIPLLNAPGGNAQVKSGALTGAQGSTVPEFSSVNLSEMPHISAVRSVLGVMEN